MGVSGYIVSYQATALAKVMTSTNLASWQSSHVWYSSKKKALCSGNRVLMKLQRRAARTEPEWTFTDLYSSLSISDEYQVLDIKICSDGKTDWVSIELLQPTELCTYFSEESCLFQSGEG